MKLTERQQPVMQGYADGLTQDEIAEKMHISIHTVRTHRDGALKALGANGLPHAVAIALRAGLIS